MANVTIKKKDGTVLKFTQQPQQSRQNTVEYIAAFVVIKDGYGTETAIPAADVLEVISQSTERGRW